MAYRTPHTSRSAFSETPAQENRGRKRHNPSETPSPDCEPAAGLNAPASDGPGSEQRLRREEEESIALVRQLMEQEAVESYQLSLDAMRQQLNGGDTTGISEEDLRAMRAAMGEAEEEEGAEDSEGDDNEEESEVLDYDALISLGSAIGDVRTDRWRMRAREIINRLPCYTYGERPMHNISPPVNIKHTSKRNVKNSGGSSSSGKRKKGRKITDVKCLVCMCEYEKGESVRELPCMHVYHKACIDEYLAVHSDKCPLCKVSVDVA